MTEPHQKPPGFDDKPPPYSPIGGPEYPNAYGATDGYNQPQPGAYSQQQPGAYSQTGGAPPPPPHIFTAQPPVMGYQMGPGVPIYGASTAPTQIIIVGGCPACRIGVLEDEFTCCGICLGIVLFPLGLLCCLAMRQRRCPNCGAIFG